MKTADFDYHLPENLIAQFPVSPRDHARLLIVNRNDGRLEHQRFYELGNWLQPGDLLVINTSKVFKARLRARLASGAWIEVFLLRPEGSAWLALAKPGKKLAPQTRLKFDDILQAEVLEKCPDGTIRLSFNAPSDDIFAWTDVHGAVPVPPYIRPATHSEHDYQTVYADTIGSVAAPTAGLHFTPELIEALKLQDISFASVTLHVGLGTFRPLQAETLEEHLMHSEWVAVPEDTRRAVQCAKQNGHRVIAVGTTSVRALESDLSQGMTDLFITPGYRFKYVDGLITNFHLPKSTLLVLVSALAGQNLIRQAYREAIEHNYRFFSFGDAMLII